MSALLYVVGAIVVMLGVAMVGYGIPINEFSFGNTLIVAGTTATVGGLIVIALGVAVAQMQRLAEALGVRTAVQSDLPLDTFEPVSEPPAAAPTAGRVPFPPKAPKAKVEADRPPAERPAAAAAPALRNPDISLVEEYEKIFLLAEGPMSPPAPSRGDLGAPARPAPPPSARAGTAEKRFDTPSEPAWRTAPPPPPPGAPPPPKTPARQPRTGYFDSMWPAAEQRPARSTVANEPRPEPPEMPPRESAAAPPEAPKPPPPEEEPRAVAILKSGVIDGMGYTLYVDGSIEAELPQGTLRFASINDLRNHLGKNS